MLGVNNMSNNKITLKQLETHLFRAADILRDDIKDVTP